MGQIIIEIPQNMRRTYRIVSEDSAQEILADLERITEAEKAVEDDDILSLWIAPAPSVKKKAA